MDVFSKERPFLRVVLEVASIWIISDIGYYLFLPALGFGGGYNANPWQISIYYIFWLILAVYSFEDIFKSWMAKNDLRQVFIITTICSIFVALYLVYVLPNFPAIKWVYPWKPPAELLFSTNWYFLPKTFDILLQQILFLVIVLSFSAQGYNLFSTSLWSATLFGGAHLLLVFGGNSAIYTLIFTLSAIFASFVFPFLLLKVKNGFIYSYFLHWIFYAVIVVLDIVLAVV